MPSSPAHIALLVVLTGLLIGVVFGAVGRLSRFCTMGAIFDTMAMGDTHRLRLWVWAALVALWGTQALGAAGLVDLPMSIYTQPRLLWLSQAVGSLLFGAGMVFASGCGSRALVRAGGGNLKSVVVLLVIGVVAQMSLRGILAVPRSGWLDAVHLPLGMAQDLPTLLATRLPLDAATLRGLCVLLVSLPALAWLVRDRGFLRPLPLLAGLLVGGTVVAAWFATGTLGYVAEHPDTLEPAWLATGSRRPESLSFVTPLAHTLDLLTLWSDQNTRINFGIATVLGTLLGSMGVALLRREFRWEGFRDPADMGAHLGGAAMMGFGGVLALGCSIGQGLSGLSTLSTGSFIAVPMLVLGCVLALRLQMRGLVFIRK